jgi:hypothetical protein
MAPPLYFAMMNLGLFTGYKGGQLAIHMKRMA